MDKKRVDKIATASPCKEQSVHLIAPSCKHYISAATATNTRIAYQCDLKHFESWGGTIPATSQTICQYLTDHAKALRVSTLQRRLVAIKRAHTTQGYGSPTDSEAVKAVFKGIQRLEGSEQIRVEPILKADLLKLIEDLSGVKGIRDRALFLLGFAAALRRSELVGLDFEDIQFVEQGLILHLRSSKTDQAGRGRQIGIPYARGPVCPASSLLAWYEVIDDKTGPIFRPVKKSGEVIDARLSSHAVAQIIKRRVSIIGLDSSKFSGHSLRAGLVTSAAQAGVSLWKIKRQTGHKSDAMLHRYIRSARMFIDNAAAELF